MNTTEIYASTETGWEHFKIELVAGFCKQVLMSICFLIIRKILYRLSTPRRVSLNILYNENIRYYVILFQFLSR
jgi:hypothetical protein